MFHTRMFYPLKTRQLGQLQMCILDHVAIFLRVEKYMPQGLVDNFPKVIRQINSTEPDTPSQTMKTLLPKSCTKVFPFFPFFSFFFPFFSDYIFVAAYIASGHSSEDHSHLMQFNYLSIRPKAQLNLETSLRRQSVS